MNEMPRRLTEDELAELSVEIQKIASQCRYLGDGLNVLTSTIAVFVEYHIKDQQARIAAIDACIEQFRSIKKKMRSKIAKH